MADHDEGGPDWAGGGESGTARIYTATAGAKTKTFADYNDAIDWCVANGEPGNPASVSTK